MPALSVLTEQIGGILTISLNRPGKLNAIDNGLAQALWDALTQASRDESVRCMCIRGNGKAFCAGRDISAPPTGDDLALVQSVARAIVSAPKPVLAAVHGWTIGAGFEWMLCADIVIAAESARFKLPEASLGVFVTGGISATLPASVGLGRAKALMLLGETFTARQAEVWGLVASVVSEAGFDEAVSQCATRLASLEPAVSLQFKRVINEVGLADFDRAITLENQAHALLMQTVSAPEPKSPG